MSSNYTSRDTSSDADVIVPFALTILITSVITGILVLFGIMPLAWAIISVVCGAIGLIRSIPNSINVILPFLVTIFIFASATTLLIMCGILTPFGAFVLVLLFAGKLVKHIADDDD